MVLRRPSMLFRHPSLRERRRRPTHANIIVPRFRFRGDPEFILNPNGSQILSLTGVRRPMSPSKVEVPCRPRMRHDPSRVDMMGPQLPVEDDEDDLEAQIVPRKNPCCLCKVGFFHGAMNFAIVSTGVHFFLMFYCIYIALFTPDYTLGFLNFWGIKGYWDTKSGEFQNLVSEIHVTSIVGSVAELFGLTLGIGLIFSIVKEKRVFCRIWCVLSSITTAIEMFGVAFLATRLSFMIMIPIPFAVMVQGFGLWVIITYIRTLGDPRKCPVCHHLLSDHRPEPSDHSLPAAISGPRYHASSTKTTTTQTFLHIGNLPESQLLTE